MDQDYGTIVDQFKKGYKTTEFWVSLISGAIPVGTYVAKLFGYEVSAEELATAMTGLVPGMFYIVGRSWLKRKRVEAVATNVPAFDEPGVDHVDNPELQG